MILNLKLEVGVTNASLLQQTITDLHTQGKAGSCALTDMAEAAAEIINADIPLSDAGLELVHWESDEGDEEDT